MIKKSPQEVVFGDIILANALFEENTPDFYQGFDSRDICSEPVLFKEKPGKIRPVMVVDVSDSYIHYLPLTSSSGCKHDEFNQYQIQHYENYWTGDAFDSFVEIGSLRALKIWDCYEVAHVGRLHPDDLATVETRLQEFALDPHKYERDRDKRFYLPSNNRKAFDDICLASGYTKREDKYIHEERGHQLSFEGNILKSHYDATLEEVLKKHHSGKIFTLRSKDTKQELEGPVKLLVDHVSDNLSLKGMSIDIMMTNRLPRAVDAFAYKRGDVLTIDSRNQHGVIDICGKYLLNQIGESPHKSSTFTAWFEQSRDLGVTNPITVTPEDIVLFDSLGIPPVLSLNDLIITDNLTQNKNK